MKFNNVPDLLTASVLDALRRLEPRSREMAWVIASGVLIDLYLGPDTVNKVVIPALAEDGRFREINQVISAAAIMFRMRNEPGFEEFCRRLKGRDFRAAYFEIFAAGTFLKGGYRIHSVSEVGIKRKDFDFWVESDGERINVEVTAITAPRFSHNTVLNALNAKRKQLPTDAPAVIFCALPESWAEEEADWEFRRRSLAFEFLRQTRRINAVIFLRKHNFSYEDHSGIAHFAVTYFNPKPSFSLRRPEVLIADTICNSPQEAMLMFEQVKTEFLRWVEWLTPKEIVEKWSSKATVT